MNNKNKKLKGGMGKRIELKMMQKAVQAPQPNITIPTAAAVPDAKLNMSYVPVAKAVSAPEAITTEQGEPSLTNLNQTPRKKKFQNFIREAWKEAWGEGCEDPEESKCNNNTLMKNKKYQAQDLKYCLDRKSFGCSESEYLDCLRKYIYIIIIFH